MQAIAHPALFDEEGLVHEDARAAGREPAPPSLDEAVASACELIAPLWPLRHFVAVNPFLGLSDRPLHEAAREVDRLLHGRAVMPADFYRTRHASGRISDADLAWATAEAPRALARPELARLAPAQWREALLHHEPAEDPAGEPRVHTIAEAIDHAEGTAWSRTIVDEIARWCAARFDAGQAVWKQPWRELPAFAAWREAACIDRSPEIRGLQGFREYVKRLPAKPMDAIATILWQLGLPAAHHRDFLARQLASIAGWAGHLQYLARQAALEGRREDALPDLLAIRLAFDGALHRAYGTSLPPVPDAVASAPADAPTRPGQAAERLARAPRPPRLTDREVCLVWQIAYEAGYRRQLLAKLESHGPRPGRRGAAVRRRRALQAVFCIDVRSELVRRHLESSSPEIQTIGFAGFFGMPLEYVRLGEDRGAARCPVLIAPGRRIRERAVGGAKAEARMLGARRRHRLFEAVRKLSVGAFPMVETVGHFFGLRLIGDSLGWTEPHEDDALFAARDDGSRVPSLDVEGDGPDAFGLSLSDRVDWAEGALRNMGLTEAFADVVLLVGHGGHSANNPYASSLDCGACGGHAGDVNARVAAAVLDSPAVRDGLAERGIVVPASTRFVAALHDTTRDTITLLSPEGLSVEARWRIEKWLDAACTRTREERSPRLGDSRRPGLDRRLQRRARDWSEVRPEWGLAGNAAFIAAPRARTRGLDLEGRVFLHDYDAESDESGAVLELVLSAPMVVASWINLQYYASTVDNTVFGSGDKVLHNVVGRHGVMLGNRSDLQTGLPWQSVHDGRDFVHEPLRLTAIVEAPRARIERVLASHPEVRELVDGEWIHLIALDPEDGGTYHWQDGDDRWRRVAPDRDMPA